MQQDLFIQYNPADHFRAHVLEHLIGIEANRQGVKTSKLTTGSGLIHVVLKHGSIIDIQQLLSLETVSVDDIGNEARVVFIETFRDIDTRGKLFYNLIQYRADSCEGLVEKIENEYQNILRVDKTEELLSLEGLDYLLIHEGLRQGEVEGKAKPKGVQSKGFHLPSNTYLPIRTKLAFLVVGFCFSVESVLAGEKLTVVSDSIASRLNDVLVERGLVRSVGVHLYKGYGHNLYLVAQLHTLPEETNEVKTRTSKEMENLQIQPDLFEESKQKILKKLSSHEEGYHHLLDETWQRLEWKEIISVDERKDYFEDLTATELQNWWQETFADSTKHVLGPMK